MRVTLKTLKQQVFVVEMEPTATVGQLKEAVAAARAGLDGGARAAGEGGLSAYRTRTVSAE